MNNIESVVTVAYLLRKLTEPIKESQAYQSNIINDKGQQIRNLTESDKGIYTPVDAFVYKLRSLLGPKVDLLHNELALEYIRNYVTESSDLKLFEKEIIYFNKINNILEILNSTIQEAKHDGLPDLAIEKIIFEKISNLPVAPNSQ